MSQHDHPSMGDHHDWEPGEDDDELPEGITRDQMEDLVRKLRDATNGVGLYMNPFVQVHSHAKDDPIILIAQFDIGKVAFLPRVQDPVQDSFNDAFSGIEREAVKDKKKDILGKFTDGD